MPDGRKQILSLFTERKKQKAWNRTREKYMPVKRRQNLAETDWGSHHKEKCLEEFLDSTGVWCRCFPVNFAKFLGTPFLQNTSGRLLLYRVCLKNFIFAKQK